MMSLEEMQRAAEEHELRHVDAQEPIWPDIRWGWILAVAVGVLIGIYFADCFRGTP